MGYERATEEFDVPARTMTRERVVAYVCDNCGMREETDESGYVEPGWLPIRVEAGEDAEEGHQIAERIYCEDCFAIIADALVRLGFGTHYHGSTNFLEDTECPGRGAGECPVPQLTRYGDDED